MTTPLAAYNKTIANVSYLQLAQPEGSRACVVPSYFGMRSKPASGLSYGVRGPRVTGHRISRRISDNL